MVSKSKILGQSSIVFVTIGTTEFSFNRLLQSVDNVLQKYNQQKYYLIAQVGNSNYNFHYPNTQVFKFLSPNQLNSFFKKAEKIITHAGYGTLFKIEQTTQVYPLIVSRNYQKKEHVDDHQVHFAKYLKYKLLPHNRRLFVVTNQDITKPLRIYLTLNANKKKRNFRLFKYAMLNKTNELLLHKIKKVIDD